MILNGKGLAARIRSEVKEKVSRLARRGVRPGLAFFLEYPSAVDESALLERIEALNADAAVCATRKPPTHGQAKRVRDRRRRQPAPQPVPGGVGPMTIAMLLENCVAAASR